MRRRGRESGDAALRPRETRREATIEPWQVPVPPAPLTLPGIEISGPASIPSMMVQALNPDPEGERAVGYLDEEEDSGGGAQSQGHGGGHTQRGGYAAR